MLAAMRYTMASLPKGEPVRMAIGKSMSADIYVCMSKEPYPTSAIANHALRAISKGRHLNNADKMGGMVEVYKCLACGQYHHGHNRKKRRGK